MTVQDERVDDALYALVPGDPRPWRDDGRRQRPGHVAPGLAAATDGRLLLRPFEPEDAPAVQAACDDPDVAHWIYRLPAPYTLADAEWFIADARDRLVRSERARLAVTDAASGELLGSVSLDLFAGREAAEIGYWVKREARRRGVALGAARLIIAWAFGEVGVERLGAAHLPGQRRSRRRSPPGSGSRVRVLCAASSRSKPGKSRDGRVGPLPDGTLPAARRPGPVRAPRSDAAPA